jgi:ABC-2 type transport system permease protein
MTEDRDDGVESQQPVRVKPGDDAVSVQVSKIRSVAVREYIATVRTKAFVISLVSMPIMMLAGGAVGVVTRKLEDKSEKRFVIVDRTPGEAVWPRLEDAARYRNEVATIDQKTGERKGMAFKLERVEPSAIDRQAIADQRFALSERVRNGEIVGFLEIGPNALKPAWKLMLDAALGIDSRKKAKSDEERKLDPSAIRYQSKPTATGAREFYNWAMLEVTLAVMGVERPREMEQAYQSPVISLGLSRKDPVTGEITDDEGIDRTVAPMLVAVGMIMLMFMIVMVGAMPLMQGVLEERLQKIAEVLLGSVTPFELMAGKLLGGVGIALTLAGLYFTGVYALVWYYGYAEFVPLWLIAWFLFFAVLSVLMNAAAFIAVGAACTDMKDPQTLMMPVMLPTMLPLMLLGLVLTQPESLAVQLLSYFPTATPMIMTARLAMSSTLAWWEPLVGAAIVLAFTIFIVWAAGRIFRVGLLMQGNTPRFHEMLMWVFEA